MTRPWRFLQDRVVAVGTGRSRRLVMTGALTFLVGGAVAANFALFGVMESHLSKAPPPLPPPGVTGRGSGGGSGEKAAPTSGQDAAAVALAGSHAPNRGRGPAFGGEPSHGGQPVLGGPEPDHGSPPPNQLPPTSGEPPATGSQPETGPPAPGLAEFPLPVLAVIPLLAVMALTLTWHRRQPRGRGHRPLGPSGQVRV